MSQVTTLTVTSSPEVPLEDVPPEELSPEDPEEEGPLLDDVPDEDGPLDEDEPPLEEPDELEVCGQQSTSFSYWNQYSIFGSGSVPKRTSFIRTMALIPTGNNRQSHPPPLLVGAGSSQQSSIRSWQHFSSRSMSTPLPSMPTPSLGSSTEL